MENVIGMNEHYLWGDGDAMYENQARRCPEDEFGKITHNDFVELICLIERHIVANKEFAEKSKARMRAYRSTPEGLKKSRESSRKSAKKWLEKQKTLKKENNLG
jgi:hypothetical protein